MAKIPGLQRRNLTWFLRVRVPKDVAKIIGKTEIIQSLETRDYDVAAKRIHTVRSGIEAMFQKERHKLAAEHSETDVLSEYSEHDLVALSIKWLNDIRAKEEAMRMKNAGKWSEEQKRDYYLELQQYELMSRQEALGMTQPDRHNGLTMAVRFLKAEGISFSRQSDNFVKLGHFFSKAIHEVATQRLRMLEGKAHIPTAPEYAATSSNSLPHPKNAIRMGDLLKEFLADPKLRRSELALKNYRVIGRAIEEVIGNDTYAHLVTREQCKAIGSLLFSLPTNAFKKTKAKTLAQAATMGVARDLPRLSDSTYNTYMQKLNALMEYAVNETYITANPAKKLYVPSTIKDKDRRDPFTIEQLKTIFGHSDYKKLRPNALKYAASGKVRKQYAQYWIPLIALWSGMRLNEICQLHVSDIKKIDNVHAILIRETTDSDDDEKSNKKVKTRSGVRTIPVHPALIEAGFLEYVASVQKAGKGRIFPDLKLDKRGYYSHEFSKWFTRYLEKISAKTPKTSFHSFRHTYRDAIRRAKLPRDVGLQLGGWSSGATDENYGSGLGVRDLYKEAYKIKYTGLNLQHLYK